MGRRDLREVKWLQATPSWSAVRTRVTPGLLIAEWRAGKAGTGARPAGQADPRPGPDAATRWPSDFRYKSFGSLTLSFFTCKMSVQTPVDRLLEGLYEFTSVQD